MQESDISRVIIEQYTKTLLDHLQNDVVIIGSGPSGLIAAYYLAKKGIKTAVFEKRLSIGGGIWGGAAGYTVAAVEDRDILEELEIRTQEHRGMQVIDAVEFATGLGYRAVQSGAKVFTLLEFEDVILKDGKVSGVVLKNATISMANLPVDPFCVEAKCVIDATGHQAEVVAVLQRKIKDFPIREIGEGPLDVATSEQQVVEQTGEIYPGVYLTGMSVCSAYQIPRMGPIFGGMLKSGKKTAEQIAAALK